MIEGRQFQQNTAAPIATIRPVMTGRSSALTADSRGTRAKPAAATSEDQAINVPPLSQPRPSVRLHQRPPVHAGRGRQRAPLSGT